jgi:hypothetical protein
MSSGSRGYSDSARRGNRKATRLSSAAESVPETDSAPDSETDSEPASGSESETADAVQFRDETNAQSRRDLLPGVFSEGVPSEPAFKST